MAFLQPARGELGQLAVSTSPAPVLVPFAVLAAFAAPLEADGQDLSRRLSKAAPQAQKARPPLTAKGPESRQVQLPRR